jgi:DNA-binding SARP family transcriptional activator/LysM repeat protein
VAGGLCALVGLLLVVVGVPVALWSVIGWPLPRAVPSPSELRDALAGSTIPDAFFPKALAGIAWLVWAQFLAALAAEAAAAVRGTMPIRILAAGWGVQATAARLVATILLLLPSSALVRPVAASTLPLHPAAVVAAAPATTSTLPQADPATGAGPSRPADEPPATTRTYQVEAGDTLWGIAGGQLRDPYRWPELFDLNRGSPLPDPPGGRFLNPNRIYPGQRLRLPADASGPPATPRPTPPPAPDQPSPVPPGHQPLASPGTTATTPPTSTTAAPTSTPAPTTTAPQPPATTLGGHPTAAPVPTSVLAVGALLAAGVLAVLGRLRRRQQRHRQPGRRITLPTGPAADTERQLRAAAEPEAAHYLDLALRAMAAAVHHAGLPAPAVDAVELGPTELVLLLAEPAPAAPPPFAPADDGRRWVVPRDHPPHRLEALAGDALAPLPGLVTLGTSATGQLLLNLERPGLTALAGSMDATRPLLDAMAVELATAAATAGPAEVLLVGFGAELGKLERVRRAERLDDVLPDLERQAHEAINLVDQLGCGSALGGRVAGADGLAPTVVLAAQTPAPAALDRLAALTSNPDAATVAAVVAGDVPQARLRLEVGTELARVPDLGLVVHPQRLTAEEYGAIGELLRDASSLDGVEPDAPPYGQLQQLPPTDPADPANPPAVEVCVLGRVELRGVPRIERAKSVELVAYLALHPQGVDSDRLWEALWPGKPFTRGTLHTTAAVARSGLGRAGDGSRYLPDGRDGLYRLSPAVGLDWAHFQVLARRADDPGALRQALELVRGVPLEPPTSRGYDWAVAHRTEMETVVAETAERLGELCLDAGDPKRATWAARRGLDASPYDERLYRLLMRAAHADGNPAGVETVWHELLTVLGADLDYVDQDVHPDTLALYADLRGRAHARPGRPTQPRRSLVELN